MDENQYPLLDTMPELVRLDEQDQEVNSFTRYPAQLTDFPTSLMPPTFHPYPGAIVLDFGCGPGGWCRAVAAEYPQIQVIGVDSSQQYIEYAANQAIAHGPTNVSFVVGDFLNPLLAYKADLIHARFASWFISNYEATVKNWLPLLNTGGTLLLTEGEAQHTNSASFNRVLGLMLKTMVKASGPDSGGITLRLRSILHRLQFHNIGEVAHVINFSAGIPGREKFVENFAHGVGAVKPHLLPLLAENEIDILFEQMLKDLYENSQFMGLWYLLSVFGVK